MNSSHAAISAMCEDFVDSDDLEDNDEELGALGSILSWDDEADQRPTTDHPDVVEFSSTDVLPAFNFKMPLPTPLAGMRGKKETTPPPPPLPPTPITTAPPPVAPAVHQIPGLANMSAQFANANTAAAAVNFAQLLAQQAGNFFQQQQQQQSTPADSTAPQPLPLRPALPSVQGVGTPVQPVPPANAAQPNQATPAIPPAMQQQLAQLPFADPNLLFQQLQFAQFQQQLAAAQQTQQQKPSATPPAIPPATIPQQQTPQQLTASFQQLQAQFAQAAKAMAMPANKLSPAPQPKKTRARSIPKAAPKTAITTGATRAEPISTVSASDTEGESTKQELVTSGSIPPPAKKTKTEPLDTSNMSPSEKAKANRDRNREHARNTRLRKKAYLEKLKVTVDDLCRERDTLVSERATAANLLVEMHNTRTEVLMSFFALRTSNEKRRKLWTSILDESCFTCVLPVTPYRSFPASEVQVSKSLRTILGIDSMMADTASLHVLLDTLVDRSKFPHGRISFRYTLVTEETVVAGNQIMARWTMVTTDAVQKGAAMEVSKHGMLCCKFNSAHKITGLELMFDVMAFMLQLKQAAGSDGFSVVPNTVQTCQRSFDKPMVLTMVEAPYTIVQVNKLWELMTGYSANEVVGKASCSILQCGSTEQNSVKSLMQEVRHKRPGSAMITNRTKSGDLFSNFIVVFPLSTDSRIMYYLGLSTFNERVENDKKAGKAASNILKVKDESV